MPFRLEPHVAGELGEGTVLDPSTHPPVVSSVEYVLDGPNADDLVTSFPVFLVSEALASELQHATLSGLRLDPARAVASIEYRALYGGARHQQYRWLRLDDATPADDAWIDADYRLCVSDRMMAVLRRYTLDFCDIEPA